MIHVLKEEKIGYLEGLRGVASLSVVFAHFILAFYPALYSADPAQIHTKNRIELLIANSPFNFLYNGSFAVCVFYVLSAYVLSCKYFRTSDNTLIVRAAFRRYLRLVIPILFSVLCAWGLLKLGLSANIKTAGFTSSQWWLASMWQFAPNLITALKEGLWNCFFAFDFSQSYNGVLWTLQYELAGSFLIFGFLAVFGKTSKRYVAYIAGILIFAKGYYLAFILGLILSDIFNSPNLRPFANRIRKGRFITFLSIIIVGFLGSYFDNRELFKIIDFGVLKGWGFDLFKLYHIIGAFVLVFAILNSRLLQRIFEHKIMMFLGRISFSLYLMHLMVILTLSCQCFLYFRHFITSYSSIVFITAIISMPIIIGVSYLTAKYIDEPGIRVSRRVSSLLEKNC